MTLGDGTSCRGARHNLLLAALGLAAFLLAPAVARGHEGPTASLRVEGDGAEARVTLTLPLRDLAGLVDVDPDGDGLLTRTEYEGRVLPDLYRHVVARLALTSDGTACAPSLGGPAFPAARAVPLAWEDAALGAVVAFRAPGPLGDLRLRCAPLTTSGHDRRVVSFAHGPTAVLEGERDTAAADAPSGALARVGAFARSGAWHILIGWDHLAFLLALLIAARDLRAVTALVTAFTCAHSLTLGLTAVGAVSAPPAAVEPVIALSIAWAAWRNLRGGAGAEAGGRAWTLAFAFGLVHGFGFGGCLLDLDVARPGEALLGFNLGVELGQLAVVTAVWPALALLRRHREGLHRALVVKGASGALVALGLGCAALRVAGV